MKLRFAFLFLFLCQPLYATTFRAFEAKSPQDQGSFLADYINKMATDIAVKNPALGRAIVKYFADTPKGKSQPDGVADLMAQVVKVDALARQGKADPDNIQIESMIVYVVKQKFGHS